ncbi:MAG: aminotransferase class I/II-fold pyridoxal phosphate-dependent enzyme [Bacteroidetes bacterium]|jgi:aspartate aminotransferase|nr:aminotransferase class I/II-fold pyridoxal phosphate-dependent enzyme [Bacteroidota bacterium]
MEKVSTRLASLAPSATIAMNQKSRDLKAQGKDVINLSVGEPDFNTPDHIKQAAKDAIDNNFSFYPPVAGYPELKEAICEKFRRENNLDYKPDQTIVSTGAKHSIANVILSLVDKGDEVIIPAPYWVSYADQVKIAEGKNVIISGAFDNNYKVTPDQIDAAITPKTKAILLCSPSNPTGAVYTKPEMEAIAQVLKKHEHVYIISDEIYEHINFIGEHVSIANFDYLKDRTVVVNGVSKAYAMTGWRIGYIGAPQWITNACIKLQGQTTTGATTIAQKAAYAALTGDQHCVQEMKVAFERRKNLVVDRLKEIPGIKGNNPQGAFYVFPDVSAYFGKSVNGQQINTSTDLCMYLLEDALIATVPGDAFGDPHGIRISFATSDKNLDEAMSRMKKAIARIQ